MSCKIMLLNFYGLYAAGSTIVGQVVCNFPQSVNVRGIHIRLKGSEKVQWRAGKHHHKDQRILFNEEKILRTEGDVQPGRVEYPFTFTLPTNIPTSYGGKYGWVKYSLKAVVDIPFAIDYTNKVILPVILPQDLNKLTDRSAFSPAAYSVDSEVSSCCIPDGNVAMEVRLEKTAFVPGEVIKVGVRIINLSRQNVARINVQLKMTVTSKSFQFFGTYSKEEKFCIAEIDSAGCGAHGQLHSDIPLKIPLFDAVPNFCYSKLLSLTSKLKVTGVIQSWCQDMVIKIPVYLADIAIGEAEEYFRRFTQPQGTYFQFSNSQSSPPFQAMSCRIDLKNHSGPFLAGSKIFGKVICEFKCCEEIRGIILKLIGKEKISWTRTRTTYTEKNYFFAELRYLLSEANVEPGISVYPFEFTLPPDIPSTYGGWFGTVQYTIKVIVDRFLKFDLKNKIRIEVVLPQDLNKLADRSWLEPGTCTAEKTVWSWNLSSEPIAMEAYIEKKVFVPGEEVKIGVKIWNKSNQPVQGVKVSLRTEVKSQLSNGDDSIDDVSVVGHVKQDKFIAEQTVRHNTLGLCTARHYEVLFNLPRFIVPNFTHSRLLTFKPELEIVAILPILHMNLKKSIPIHLVDIPLGDSTVYQIWLRSIGGLNPSNLETLYRQFDVVNHGTDCDRDLL